MVGCSVGQGGFLPSYNLERNSEHNVTFVVFHLAATLYRRGVKPPSFMPDFYPHFTIGFCETASEACAVFDWFTTPSVATGLTGHFK